MVRAIASLAVILGLLALPASGARANSVCCLTGTATIQSPDGVTRAAGTDAPIAIGDTVTTGPDSRATLHFDDGSSVIIGPDSSLTVDAYLAASATTPSRVFRVVRGLARIVSGLIVALDPDRFRVIGGYAGGGIRGTILDVAVAPGGPDEFALVEGGPVDVSAGAPMESFDDSLFTDPSDKSLATMDLAAFATAAAAAGMTLWDFFVGDAEVHSLTEPGTGLRVFNREVIGPIPLVIGGIEDCGCPPIAAPASLGLLATTLALGAPFLHRRRRS